MTTEDVPLQPISEELGVGIQDKPTQMVRNPSDLVGVIGCALGIVLVCLTVVYAHNTTEGISEDVQGFAVLLQRLLFVPVAVLDTIVILFPPIAVGIDLLVRRYPIVALRGLFGAIGGIILTVVMVFLLNLVAPISLVSGLSVRLGGSDVMTIPPYVAAITALLTAVATPASRRSITWSWNFLWMAVVVAVVTTTAALPGMAIALLIGRLAGYAIRYGMGVASQRAYGQALVDGVRRAGFSPVILDRVSTIGVRETGESIQGVQTPQFFSDHRLYVMETDEKKMYNVIVLDGDRQMMSILTRVWRYLRSKAIQGGTTLSLRQTAERTALISYAVRSCGVSTPNVLAIAEADDSMLIIREATKASVSFVDLDSDQVSDELLDRMWNQILKAHRCGVAHRSLTPECFRVSADQKVSVLGWESGDVASSELAARIDLTQLMAVMATKVTPERVLASAGRALEEQELGELGPLLQIPAVPKQTRDNLGDVKEVLAQLRTQLLSHLPDAEVEPEQIARVGARTVLMIVLVTVAIIVVLTSFNLAEVVDAIRHSDWRWAVGAFVMGLMGFVGASLTLMAFSPVKLRFWRAVMCQISAAFVAVAAPVGLGPAAVNVRVLTKKQVPTPVAAATVALTQVSNIVVTVLLLVVLTAITGTSQLTSFEVTPGVLVGLIVIAAVISGLLIVPKSRTWLLARLTPMLKQTWPRLVELFSNPYRLGLGLLGNLIVIVSYVTALQWAVFAFGRDISFLGAALVYVIGTAAGSVVPTPGGMGPIEVAESAALVSLGINPGVAASIVLLFRFVTYWIRIPLGWVAYKSAQKLGEL
ncbi:MAG: flippase-like domain-containing protein [Propionibacteriaceae bacterium]|jgi:uncharacterized protein (TIRG00374 family)|nr:flippase-like domain-containing protein [Propionibacteriaceae bacterium]